MTTPENRRESSAATVGPRVDSPAGIGYIRAMVNTAPRLGARGMGGYGPLTDEWRDTIEKLLAVLEEHLDPARELAASVDAQPESWRNA